MMPQDDPAFDARDVTRRVIDIIARGDAESACDLVCGTLPHRQLWLPEALMLFNTRGLDMRQTQAMAARIFTPLPMGLSGQYETSAVCARTGRYGLSFAQWRFVGQRFGGASLLERYGMKRLYRDTDTLDDTLPDPQRDLYGAGFTWQDGKYLIEYRRAYILAARLAGPDACAVVIRNSSHFFGRDRLPAPVFVAWGPQDATRLAALAPRDFFGDGDFKPLHTAFGRAPRGGMKRLCAVLDRFDDFDADLAAWLTDPARGRPQLQAFLQDTAASGRRMPYLAYTDDLLPPWFPAVSIPAGESGPEILPPQPAHTRFVMLTGADGDKPFGPSKQVQAPPASAKLSPA